MAKNFKDLSQAEILALTISNEETDAGVYEDFATRLRDNYPATPRCSKKWRPRKMGIAFADR